jgi:broad specificity phosphatase PhoE
MALFIRHGKARKHDRDTTIDTSLTSSGREDSRRMGAYLARRNGGSPHEIRCSPFKRCRETAKLLAKGVADYTGGQEPAIIVDLGLCRFTNQDHARIRKDTAAYGRVLLESDGEFKKRAREYAMVAAQHYANTGQVTWHVTHGIVVKNACKHFNIGCPRMVNSCGYVNVMTGKCRWD